MRARGQHVIRALALAVAWVGPATPAAAQAAQRLAMPEICPASHAARRKDEVQKKKSHKSCYNEATREP